MQSERKKSRSSLPNVATNKLLVGLSIRDYIRKELKMNHVDKVSSKAAKR